ncbi:MAG: AI-2E family transporter [Actinomycetota bacterium]
MDEPRHPRGWPPITYWIRATIAVVATALLVLAAVDLASVATLVLIALVLSVGLDPLVRGLEARGLRRGPAVAAIVLVVVLAVAGFVATVVPALVHQVAELAAGIPRYADRLAGRDDWIGAFVRSTDFSAQLQTFIRDIPNAVAGSFGTIVGFTGQVVGAVFSTVTVAILTVYFLAALPRARRLFPALVHRRDRVRATRILDEAIRKIGRYVVGNLVTSLVCAILALLALLAIDVPYAIPLAVWAGIADLLPVVGAYLGALPAIVVAFFVSPTDAVLVALYFALYQQVENFVIQPRVMRDAVDLSPAAVILSTLAGALLAGFAGALLALPVAATMKVIVSDVWLAERIAEVEREPLEPDDPAR